MFCFLSVDIFMPILYLIILLPLPDLLQHEDYAVTCFGNNKPAEFLT